MIFVAALLFGIASGLRTVTPEAVYFAARGGPWGVVFPIAAIGEYIGDLLPKTPARTMPLAVLGRCAGAAFMGWTVARVPGIAVAIAAALPATYGGYRFRLWLIRRTGAIASGLIEDVIAIAVAIAALVCSAARPA